MKMQVLVGLCAAVFLMGAASKDKKLRRPQGVSPAVIKVLDKKMDGHGLAMMWLSMSVVLLEHDEVEKAALLIVNEPRLPRPAPNDPMSALPPVYFALQDELVQRAQLLATAGKNKNDAEIGSAYSQMIQTCVACHSTYLNAPAKK